ncbi:MAG TPA: lysophospholipid acyltransferase family protein [Polyangiaceae bacterium]|nr:lysophospholipid acyltransferase family protein [Polyangiaceae bacterium]
MPTVVQGAIGTLTTETCDARLDSWSRAIVNFARIELSVVGRELAPAGEAFVVMSNHQSLYDIPVLFQALQRRVRMVAKSELFKVPIWSGAMRRAGFVEIERANRVAAMRSLERAKNALAAGTSIWIAPEGTRSPTGELAEFKKGGFHLATGAGARILPVSIDGTRNVLTAKGREVHDGQKVRVTIHAPIATKDFGPRRQRELVSAVREAIVGSLSPPSPE